MFDISKCQIKESGIVIAFQGGNAYHNKLKNDIKSHYPNGVVTFLPSDFPPFANEKNKNGMLSSSFLLSLSTKPSCLIFIFDISELIMANVANEEIAFALYNEMRSKRATCPRAMSVMLIINTTSNSNVSKNVKSRIILYNKEIGDIVIQSEKNIFCVSSIERLSKEDFVSPFTECVIYNTRSYYHAKKKKIQKKISEGQLTMSQEQLAKCYIKLGAISFAVHKEKKNFSYFQRAYDLIVSFFDRTNYQFKNENDNNNKMTYFEIRNICDFLLVNILKDKSINIEDIINKVQNHIEIFTPKQFYPNNVLDSDINIKINFISWVQDILEFVSNYFNKELTHKNVITIQRMNCLLRKIEFVNINKTTIDNILSTEVDNKIVKKQNPFEEKFPIYINVDSNEEVTNVDMIIQMYFITQKKEMYHIEESQRQLKEIITQILNSKEDINMFGFYLLTTIDKNKNFLSKEERILLLSTVLKTQIDSLMKFNTVFLSLANEFISYYINDNHNLTFSFDKEKNNDKPLKLFQLILYIKQFRSLSNEEISLLSSLASSVNDFKDYIYIDVPFTSLFIASSFDRDNINVFDVTMFSISITNNFPFNISNASISLTFSNEKRKMNFDNVDINITETYSQKVKMMLNPDDNSQLYLKRISFMLKNKIVFVIETPIKESSMIRINKVSSKDEMTITPLLFETNKNVKSSVQENKYFYLKIIPMSNIIIKDIQATFTLVKENNEELNYEFITINEDGIVSTITNDKFVYINTNVNNKESITIEFILKIYNISECGLLYDITTNISHSELESSSYEYQHSDSIVITTQLPFSISSKVNCCKYKMIQNHLVYPANEIIKHQMILLNQMEYKAIVNDIIIIPEDKVDITTVFTQLLKMKKKNVIEGNENFTIPFDIVINSEFSASPGEFVMQWQSEELKRYAKDKILNVINFNFADIAVKKFHIDIDMNVPSIIENNNIIPVDVIISNKDQKKPKKILVNIDRKDSFLIDGKVTSSTLLLPQSQYKINLLLSKTSNDNLYQLPFISITEYTTATIGRKDKTERVTSTMIYIPPYKII